MLLSVIFVQKGVVIYASLVLWVEHFYTIIHSRTSSLRINDSISFNRSTETCGKKVFCHIFLYCDCNCFAHEPQMFLSHRFLTSIEKTRIVSSGYNYPFFACRPLQTCFVFTTLSRNFGYRNKNIFCYRLNSSKVERSKVDCWLTSVSTVVMYVR